MVLRSLRLCVKYQDIYFEPMYGKSCELIEDGKSEVFLFESKNGTILNMGDSTKTIRHRTEISTTRNPLYF